MPKILKTKEEAIEKILKHFPKLNIFVDPIPYDGGTAVGIAYYHENYI